MSSDAIRIGYLRDVFIAAGHDFGGNAVRMVVDEANRGGGVQGRPVELVTRAIERSPGTHDNVAAACEAWDDLVKREQVVGLIGPSTTPVAVAVLERVESSGVPAIHWAGTDEACGHWQFQYQAGYLPDEGPALAYLLARRGHRRVACFRSEGAYGQAYLRPFNHAASASGIEIACELVIPLDTAQLTEYVQRARATGADAVVAMGLFGLGLVLAKTIRDEGWQVACYGNCGFALYAGGSPEAARLLDGWTAVDLFDPHNRTAREFLQRYEDAHHIRPRSATACFARDLATLMIEGLRRAPALTRAGLRAGLESLRDLPSAAGGAGTRMGFSAHDRLALKGPRIFTFSGITLAGLRPLPA